MKIRQVMTSAIAALGLTLIGNAALADPASGSSSPGLDRQAGAPSTFTLIRGFRGGGRAAGVRVGRVGGGRARFAAVRTGPGRFAGRTVVARRGVRVAGGGRRVRYWRNGRWWYGPAAVGVGLGVAAGGSCYWNCRNTGRGPGFCRANAGNFC